MAIRKVRELGDEVLGVKCRPVTKMTDHLNELIDDMFETMYDANGVGLAAPQVGVLKRLCVIDVTEEQDEPYVLINPEILESSGEQTAYEGCLSVPNKVGEVVRPTYVKVRALDRDMNEYILEGDEIMARCLCHEIDHLDGIMYTEKMNGPLQDARVLEEQENMKRKKKKKKQ